MNAKLSFAQTAMNMATTLAAIDNTLSDMEDVWNARLYGPGAPNAITDAELLELETIMGRKITADQLYGFIIMCSQFKRFMHNEQAAVSDYAATVNHIRTDL